MTATTPSPAPTYPDLADLIGTAATFQVLHPASRRVPPPPRFTFGPMTSAIPRHFYSQMGLHAAGVFEATGLTVEGTHLLRHGEKLHRAGALNIHARDIDLALSSRPAVSRRRHLAGRHVLLAGPGVQVYGHWLAEYLPRLGLLAAAGHNIHTLSYLLPANLPGFAREWLRLLGIGKRQIVPYDAGTEQVSVESLLLPTTLHNGVRGSPVWRAAADVLADLMTTRHGDDAAAQPARIYLSRRGAHSARNLVNRAAIEAQAAQAGYVVLEPEAMPLAEQWRLFRGARVIIGEYGSALHGSLFTPSGTIIGALRADAVQPGFIQSAMGEGLGHPTGYLFGRVLMQDPGNALRYDYEIDQADFHSCLRTALAG